MTIAEDPKIIQDPTIVEEMKLPKLKAGAVEGALEDPDFRVAYERTYSLRHKFAIATALIEDGRFGDPLFLLNSLVPTAAVIDKVASPRERAKVQDETTRFAPELRERLTLQLLEKGHLQSPENEEAFKNLSKKTQQEQLGLIEDATQEVYRQNAQDPLLLELIDMGWEIEEVGELALIRRLSSLNDVQRLAEWRGWMARTLTDLYAPTRVYGNGPIDTTVYDVLERLPQQVFDNKYAIVTNLIRNRIEMDFKKHITDQGVYAGLSELETFLSTIEDPMKRAFAAEICNRFMGFATEPHLEFHNRILVNGVEKEFPSMDQIAFAYYANHPHSIVIEVDDPDNPDEKKKEELQLRRTGTRYLYGKTGRGKSGAGLLAFKRSHAKSGLIFTPAAGKETWSSEAKKLLRGPDQLFVIESVEDFTKATELINDPSSPIQLAAIGMEWLTEDPQIVEEALKMVQLTGMDGSIIDEIDRLSDYGAKQTKAVIRLIEEIRGNYAVHNPDGSVDAPIFGLTATPLRTELENLNVPMSLLYADEFAPVARPGIDPRPSFSDKVLNNPQAAYTILTGERRMYRWDHVTGIQEYELEASRLEASPFEQYLYEFIVANAKVTGLELYKLLTDMLENPALIRAEMRARAREVIPPFDETRAVTQLRNIVHAWKKQRDVLSPQTEADFLNADTLISLGARDLVLATFFDQQYRGLDRFVESITQDTEDPVLLDLKRFWQKKELSTKYQALKNDLITSLSDRVGENGVINVAKASIVIEERLQGRTRKVEQKRINGEDIYTPEELEELNDNLLVDQVARWLSKAGILERSNILVVDGKVKIGSNRDAAITAWKENPELKLLFLGGQAASRSRDFVVTHTIDSKGRVIDRLDEYHLGPFWYHGFGEQVGGRHRRQGQILIARDVVYVTRGLIDEDKFNQVEYTRMLGGMALAGYKLTEDEWDRFKDKTHLEGMEVRSRNSREQFLSKFLAYVSGRDIGVDEVREKLAKVDPRTGQPDAFRFAEAFYDGGNDRYRSSGHNAGLEVDILQKKGYTKAHKGVSIGAGTLLFQRISGFGVDNVDMNSHMMEVAWEEAREHGGKIIVAEVPGLSEEDFPDESYDFLECGFTLNWSKLGRLDGDPAKSQRAQILAEWVRLLKRREGGVPGGTLVLTVSKSAFDDESFGRFVQALEQHFGFTVDPLNSGKTFGRSQMSERHRIGWSITAERTGDVDLEGLDLQNLMFTRDHESRIVTPRRKKKKGSLDGGAQIIDVVPIRQAFSEYEIENPLRRRGEIILPVSNGHAPVDSISIVDGNTPVEDENGYASAEDIVAAVSDTTSPLPADSLVDDNIEIFPSDVVLEGNGATVGVIDATEVPGEKEERPSSPALPAKEMKFYTSFADLTGPDSVRSAFYRRELIRPVSKMLGGWDTAETFCKREIVLLEDRIRREIAKRNRMLVSVEDRVISYEEQRAIAYGIILSEARKNGSNGRK